MVDIIEGTDTAACDPDKLGFTFKEPYPDSNLRDEFPRFNRGFGSCTLSQLSTGWLSEDETYAMPSQTMWRTTAAPTPSSSAACGTETTTASSRPGLTGPNINFGPSTENPGGTGSTFANLLVGNYTQHQPIQRPLPRLRVLRAGHMEGESQAHARDGQRRAYYGPMLTRGRFLQKYFDPGRYKPSEAAVLDLPPGLRPGSIVAGNPFNGLEEEGRGTPQGFAKHRYNKWGPRMDAPMTGSATVKPPSEGAAVSSMNAFART